MIVPLSIAALILVIGADGLPKLQKVASRSSDHVLHQAGRSVLDKVKLASGDLHPDLHKAAAKAVDLAQKVHNNYKDVTLDEAGRHIIEKVKSASGRAQKVNLSGLEQSARSALFNAKDRVNKFYYLHKNHA
uniref:Uncharacterized protein n=1 Tax=Lygus hesperus TaxID=30085 RepID=A0A0K8SM55_LYGHE